MQKKEKENFEIFFKRVPANILVALRKNTRSMYISMLTKKADCTHCHAMKILQEMEKANLIGLVKQRRIKIIQLKDNGNKVAEYIENIQTLL